MTFINESIHLHGTGKLSNFLNKLVSDILGYAPAIMLMNFFSLYIKFHLTVVRNTPTIDSIFYRRMKARKIN